MNKFTKYYLSIAMTMFMFSIALLAKGAITEDESSLFMAAFGLTASTWIYLNFRKDDS